MTVMAISTKGRVVRAVVVTVLIGLTITYITAATTTALILNHTTRGPRNRKDDR